MATFPTSPAPSQASSGAIRPRVNKMSFGDGYEHRSADGLNTTPLTYTLTWAKIPEADRVTFNNFLVARGGVENFQWTPPNGSVLNWKCEDWGWTHGDHTLVDFRAVFVQDFNP
jgi:phage-related protein